MERKADGSHVVDQAVCVGASSFCSCVDRSRVFLGPFEQSAHVNAVAAQVHECAALPSLKSLWFGVEVELRAFPTARVNLELRDVALGLPAIPILPTRRRVVRRLPGRLRGGLRPRNARRDARGRSLGRVHGKCLRRGPRRKKYCTRKPCLCSRPLGRGSWSCTRAT